MIYIVEAALGAEQDDSVWDRWYASMKPPHLLLTVPGLNSAQRFKGVTRSPYAYVAVYSLDSGEVMTSAAYRNIGGGNFLTENWKPLITLWTRDLYDGLEAAPPVPENALLGFLDLAEPRAMPPGIEVNWLACAGLDKTTPYRGLAVVSPGREDSYVKAGFRLFKPLGPFHTE